MTGDGGGDAVPYDIPWLADGAPVIAPPVLGPEPYPATGPEDCPDGQAHFPGEPGCVAVGAACPPGDFSAELPVDRRVIHVQPGATGGDGSVASPYGSLAEFALGALPAGTVLALSRGVHDGPVRLVRSYVLWGACAEATVLRAAVPATGEGVVTMSGAGGEVRQLTIDGSPRAGVWAVGRTIDARIEGVVISDVEDGAVVVGDEARMVVEALVTRDTAARAADGAFGRGLSVELGSVVEVTRALFDRSHDVGVYVEDPGTDVTVTDAAVRDTQTRASDGMFGRGLLVAGGAVVLAQRIVVERNRDLGVFVEGDGAVLTMTDAIVRDTEGSASGVGGPGLAFQNGADATVQGVHLGGNRGLGAFVSGAQLFLSDAIIVETRPQESDDAGGRGLNVQRGASADVSRVVIERNRDVGIFVADVDTTLVATDLVVRDTESQVIGAIAGRGLNVQLAAVADLTRASFERNREMGILSTEPGTMVTLTDVVVRDTEAREADGQLGRGLGVQVGAGLGVRRMLLERNRELGMALGDGTATFTDMVIAGTRPRACAETTCSGAGAGHGIGSSGPGSAATMTRFSVRDSALCGVFLANDGGLDLDAGEVTGQPIGVCLQVPDYDVARLTTGVRYVDNGTNLEATSLPVPGPVEMLGGL